jgi:hypothetical protein
MTNVGIAFLVFAAILSVVSILKWRSDGRSLLRGALLNTCLGGFILSRPGWPRYVLIAAFLAVFVWSMAGTPREVFARNRWGLLLVGAAIAGILVMTFSPALVAGNERLVGNVIGIVAVAGLVTLVFFPIQDMREAARQKR